MTFRTTYLEDVRVVQALFQRRAREDKTNRSAEREQFPFLFHDEIVCCVVSITVTSCVYESSFLSFEK